MGKHNGKARKSGLTVGSALVNKARREGRTGGAAAFLHTTDLEGPKKNMQSVIESNDLDEMMAMVGGSGMSFAVPSGHWPRSFCGCTFCRPSACHTTARSHSRRSTVCRQPSQLRPPSTQADLAGKDFTAEKEHVIVISTGAVAAVDHERLAAERKAAEDRNRHR